MKHQVYRCQDKEVIIASEVGGKHSRDEDAPRVEGWNVQEVSIKYGALSLGTPFQVKPSELQWIGRTVVLKDEEKKAA